MFDFNEFNAGLGQFHSIKKLFTVFFFGILCNSNVLVLKIVALITQVGTKKQN